MIKHIKKIKIPMAPDLFKHKLVLTSPECELDSHEYQRYRQQMLIDLTNNSLSYLVGNKHFECFRMDFKDNTWVITLESHTTE